ncbi:MAG TPA: hypothetical protein GYA10_13065, partial [Alphaproteobacteria bacterium]|nr:hypothetical protein [Alphaproteobacteria bacterium]
AEQLDATPWSPFEAADARAAIEAGVGEMIAYFDEHPQAIRDMWEDAVAALIEVTYSSDNPPGLDARIRQAAQENLDALVEPYLAEDPDSADCTELEQVMPLAIYASKFYAPQDARTAMMLRTVNAAMRDCGTLGRLLTLDDPTDLANAALDDERVFDLVIWSLLFIEGEVTPGLEPLPQMRDFPRVLWDFLRTYPLRNASTYEDGAEDDAFIEAAYLATHIAYVPTGNHRFPLYIADSPALYRFHRENFYPVLEMGELDLVAEFVDSLRQYGCTEANDRQVLDGTRYLLQVFHDGDGSWMAYREPGETDADVDSYDLIHKVWTGVLGVRPRTIEQPLAGTYGGLVRTWLPAPVATDVPAMAWR